MKTFERYCARVTFMTLPLNSAPLNLTSESTAAFNYFSGLNRSYIRHMWNATFELGHISYKRNTLTSHSLPLILKFKISTACGERPSRLRLRGGLRRQEKALSMGRGYPKIARQIRNQPGYPSILGCDAPGSCCTHCTQGKTICNNNNNNNNMTYRQDKTTCLLNEQAL